MARLYRWMIYGSVCSVNRVSSSEQCWRRSGVICARRRRKKGLQQQLESKGLEAHLTDWIRRFTETKHLQQLGRYDPGCDCSAKWLTCMVVVVMRPANTCKFCHMIMLDLPVTVTSYHDSARLVQ